MENRGMFLDIGAGFGESFVKRAKANPHQRFIIIEPYKNNIPKDRPDNLTWITAEITEEYQLPFKNSSFDEINLDFLFIFLHGENKESLFPTVLTEAKRVVKKSGVILIREPQYMLRIIKPVLNKLNFRFSSKLIPRKVAEEHSQSTKEATEEEDSEMRPFLITLRPK